MANQSLYDAFERVHYHVDLDIAQHNTDELAHEYIRNLITNLSTEVNNFLDVDDTTKDQLSEVLALISSNEGLINSLTTGKVNVADIIDNLTSAESAKPLSANQGVILKQLIDDIAAAVALKASQQDFEAHVNDTVEHTTQEEKDKLAAIEEGAQVNVQSDWNENNPNSPAYIVGRTHYEVYTEDLEVILTNFNLAESGTSASGQTVYSSTGTNEDFIVNINENYVVNYPDYSVACTVGICAEYGLDSDLLYLGNISLISDEIGYDSGEPFIITTDGTGNYTIYCYSNEVSEISIVAETYTVHQLEEKYIPDTIARVITGTEGQLAGFDSEGKLVAVDNEITVKYEGDKLYGLIEGTWQELVIKSQPTRASMQVVADGTSVITIPESITSLECVDVYQNGLYLSEGINYTLDASARTVSLIDYTADANDVFAFVAY